MISLSGHPFTPAALQQYVDQAATQIAPGKVGVVTAAVDTNGVKVVLLWRPERDGNLSFQAAWAHDWSGDNRFGASGSYSF